MENVPMAGDGQKQLQALMVMMQKQGTKSMTYEMLNKGTLNLIFLIWVDVVCSYTIVIHVQHKMFV